MTVTRHPNNQGVTLSQWRYNATGGETTLSGTDAFGAGLSYTVGAEQVFVNGVLLERGVDYTASTGTTVTGLTALVAGDIVTVSSPSAFNVANAIPKATVAAKGDLIVANGAASVTNLGVGADGSTLVANSSASTGVAWAGPSFMAGRNKILNGDFSIWQRGTSFSYGGAYTFSADRWQGYGYSGTTTVSQQTFTPGTAPVAGYEGQYFARFNSNNTTLYFLTRIEDVRTLAGQTATLSFWAKSASAQTMPEVGVVQNFGSGGSSGVTALNNSTTAITTSWARYTFTFSMPSISGKTIGTGSYVQVEFQGAINNNFDIWGVQLEAGSVATPFTTATGTLQGELAACQRYFWQVINGNNQIGGYAYAWANTQVNVQQKLPVTMRTTPTLVASSGTDYYGFARSQSTDTFNSLTLDIVSTDFVQAYNGTEISSTSGGAGYFRSNNASASVAWNAEL